jgi:hypothetical protein
MAIRVQQVNAIGMAETMSSGTEFHIVPVPETARDVASPNNLVDAAADVSVMVQGEPRPTHEDDIVDRILGVQEHAHRFIPDDHAVDDPEAETGVEGCRLLDIRRMHLVVLEAKRAGATKAFKSLKVLAKDRPPILQPVQQLGQPTQAGMGDVVQDHDAPRLILHLGQAALHPALGITPIARNAVPEYAGIFPDQKTGQCSLAKQMRANQTVPAIRPEQFVGAAAGSD